jgi:hypothetical protein
VRSKYNDKWVVLVGDLNRGFEAYGPFTERQADDFIDRLREESADTEEPTALACRTPIKATPR